MLYSIDKHNKKQRKRWLVLEELDSMLDYAYVYVDVYVYTYT